MKESDVLAKVAEETYKNVSRLKKRIATRLKARSIAVSGLPSGQGADTSTCVGLLRLAAPV
jgi:hypothetical protein